MKLWNSLFLMFAIVLLCMLIYDKYYKSKPIFTAEDLEFIDNGKMINDRCKILSDNTYRCLPSIIFIIYIIHHIIYMILMYHKELKIFIHILIN